MSCTAHDVQHKRPTVIRNIITDPGWVSYLRAGAFYTTFIIRTAPGFLIYFPVNIRLPFFLPSFLSPCPVSFLLALFLIGCPPVSYWVSPCCLLDVPVSCWVSCVLDLLLFGCSTLLYEYGRMIPVAANTRSLFLIICHVQCAVCISRDS